MATKTVTSSNALDEPGQFDIDAPPNDDQCGLFDVGGSLDAPNDNQRALNESVALPKAFTLTDPVRRHHCLCFESPP